MARPEAPLLAVLLPDRERAGLLEPPAPEAHHEPEHRLPTVALRSGQSERLAKVTLVADDVEGHVGDARLISESEFYYWANEVPFGEQVVHRASSAFSNVACRPLVTRCAVHAARGCVGGNPDKMRKKLVHGPRRGGRHGCAQLLGC